ncbi:hypothetical protein TWF730_002111 [Orbilia blumenaviensis]|uniref:Maltose/galactoside acetyltransferase domain-containing protein n=1 Tax=Orbilia blumenaviensis TaxID=1796055 RepID=A0AAV9UGN7_9PEZI
MANSEKDALAIAFARTLDNIPWCEDYEKMISGVLYNAQAPELAGGRFRARKLVHRYNNYFPEDATRDSLADEREVMLRQMMGRIGRQPFMEPPINVDYGCNIVIGDNFYSNFGLIILDVALVRIGSRVMFGPNVSIYAATHETGVQSRRDELEYGKAVTIGNDCWIGGNVTIVAGVNIGKGCTIGAGSVVTKDIPDWSVAIGSPAKVVKKVDPVPDI